MASIRKFLPTVIVLQISLAMGLTAWISFTSAKKEIHSLIAKLSWQVTEHIHNQVMAYVEPVELSHELNKIAIALDRNDLTINDIENIESYFWRIVVQDSVFETQVSPANNSAIVPGLNQLNQTEYQMLESVQYIMFASETGEFIGVENQDNQKVVLKVKSQANSPRITYELNNQGKRVREVGREDYDPRDRPWYQAAKQAGKLTWSPIYTSSYDKTSLRINPVMPLYNNQGSFLGVLGIEMTLRQVGDFLSSLNISPNGKAFIIESSGELVATSANEILSISTPEGHQRLSAIDSSDSGIKATMQKLLADSTMMQEVTTQKQFELKINGRYQFIQVKRLEHPDLDWIIIVMIPEADFMDNIYGNLRVIIFLGLVTFCVAVVVGILTSRWIVKPVGILNQSAQEIESEEFNPETLSPVIDRSDELGQLALIFTSMANKIYAREQGLKKQMEQLQREKDKKKKAELLIGVSRISYLKKIIKKSRKIRKKSEEYQHLKLPELLKQVKFFQNFTSGDIQELIKIGYKTILAEGEYICREDEPGDAFYIILAGSVEIYVEKIHKFLTNLSAGAFFGELSLLLGIPRTATVRTTEETILFVVDRNGLQKLLQTYQDLADQIAAELHNHKAELEERKEMLKKWGLLDENDNSFSESPLTWIRKQMTARFGV